MSYRGPKGTYDVFPGGREPHERAELWASVEERAREILGHHNYREVRTPVFEEVELFARTAGEASDIVVQKEMFTFRDKGEREMALRPEGTPGAVRAYIEHSLFKLAQPIKLFYVGPMFRQERQQRGRYRQHTQIGVETLGTSDPLVDVEVISLLYAIHQAIGVRDEIVHLNNIGDMPTRRAYVPELRAYLQRHAGNLDPDESADVMIDAMLPLLERARFPERVTVIVENEDEERAFSARLASWTARRSSGARRAT